MPPPLFAWLPSLLKFPKEVSIDKFCSYGYQSEEIRAIDQYSDKITKLSKGSPMLKDPSFVYFSNEIERVYTTINPGEVIEIFTTAFGESLENQPYFFDYLFNEMTKVLIQQQRYDKVNTNITQFLKVNPGRQLKVCNNLRKGVGFYTIFTLGEFFLINNEQIESIFCFNNAAGMIRGKDVSILIYLGALHSNDPVDQTDYFGQAADLAADYNEHELEKVVKSMGTILGTKFEESIENLKIAIEANFSEEKFLTFKKLYEDEKAFKSENRSEVDNNNRITLYKEYKKSLRILFPTQKKEKHTILDIDEPVNVLGKNHIRKAKSKAPEPDSHNDDTWLALKREENIQAKRKSDPLILPERDDKDLKNDQIYIPDYNNEEEGDDSRIIEAIDNLNNESREPDRHNEIVLDEVVSSTKTRKSFKKKKTAKRARSTTGEKGSKNSLRKNNGIDAEVREQRYSQEKFS
jgi:hypothetical protein